MGIVDNFKAFVHSITTDDHYASYGSPYKNSANSSSNIVGANPNSSTSRLHELNRLATTNSSSHSLIEQQNAPVGYRPGLRSSTSNLRNSSDVQLQNFNNGQPPLPSIESMWNRIEAWLEEEYPELEDNINYGVTTSDLNEFENDLGLGSLPVEFRQFYKIHDGQFRGGKPTGLLMGLTLLDIESIAEEYAIWAKVSQRIEKQQFMFQQQTQREGSSSQNKVPNNYLSNQKSIPPNAVQSSYVHRGWIPISKDIYGNLIALDLAPGPAGHWGQIIVFGRDYDTKLVIASSFQEFIFGFVNDLEAGNFEIDNSESKEDDGFLDYSRDDDIYGVGEYEAEEGELMFYDRSGKELPKHLRGKLTYIEVWKRRCLKKYGINDIENFQTAFTPQRVVRRQPVTEGSSESEKRSETEKTNPLISLESSSKIALTKETLIDDEAKEDKQGEPIKEEEEIEDTPKTETAGKEEPKEESKEESKEEAVESNELESAEVAEAVAPKVTEEESEDISKEVEEAAEGLNEVDLK